MRVLAIGLAVAAVLFLGTGGRLIFLPLLFVPIGFFSLRRGREFLASRRGRRPLALRRRVG